MALGNFLKDGTYATVSTGMYEPHDKVKTIAINLMVWEDDKKEKVCCHFSFVRVGVKQPPDDEDGFEGADYISNWDTYFAPSVMDAKDHNIQQMCYDYLKALSYFSGVKDV